MERNAQSLALVATAPTNVAVPSMVIGEADGLPTEMATCAFTRQMILAPTWVAT